jgi:hypothetical protein
MRVINIDWTSDGTLFFAGAIAVCLIVAMTLDRISPKGKRRKARRTVTERPGDIID